MTAYNIPSADLTGQAAAIIGGFTTSVCHSPGFAAAAFYVQSDDVQSGDHAGPAQPGPSREMLCYAQWHSQDHFEKASRDNPTLLIAGSHASPAVRPIGGYLTSAVVNGAVVNGAVVNGTAASSTVRIAEGDPSTAVMVMSMCAPGKQAWISEYCVDATRHVVKDIPGFVSAAFHVGIDGRSFFEFVRWATTRHFQEAVRDSSFREHLSVVRQHSENQLALTRLHRIVSAPAA